MSTERRKQISRERTPRHTKNSNALRLKELMHTGKLSSLYGELGVCPAQRPDSSDRQSPSLKVVFGNASHVWKKRLLRDFSAIAVRREPPWGGIDPKTSAHWRIILAAACILFCAAGCSFAQQAPGDQTAPLTDMQRFQKIEDRWSGAINSRDQYSLELVLSPEMIDISASGEVTTRNQQITMLLRKGAGPVSLNQRVANARPFGDLAVVIGTYVEQVQLNNRQIEQKGLFTHVFRRVRDNWLCVSAQRTAILEPAPQKKRGPKRDDNAEPPFRLPMLDEGSNSQKTQPASPPQN